MSSFDQTYADLNMCSTPKGDSVNFELDAKASLLSLPRPPLSSLHSFAGGEFSKQRYGIFLRELPVLSVGACQIPSMGQRALPWWSVDRPPVTAAALSCFRRLAVRFDLQAVGRSRRER